MKASKIITCILLTVFLSACGLEDYADLDRDGKTINCPELFEYQVYVHDFEDESNYSFTQCRVEINEEKKRRCDSIIEYYIGGWHGRSSPEKSVNACSIEIERYMKKYNQDFEISGKTLKVEGVVLHKQGMVIQVIRERKIFVDKVIYYFYVEQGNTRVKLEFNSKDRAKAAHNQIADYLAL